MSHDDRSQSLPSCDFGSSQLLADAQASTVAPSDEPMNFSHVLYPEPNHYYSTMDPREIRSHIQECLTQFGNIDVVVKKFTFVCTCYVRHASTEIWINIYNDDKSTVGPRSVIEIQRRSGDGYAFCDVVRSLRAHLHAHNVIDFDPIAAKKSGWGSKAKAKAAAILAAVAASPKVESPFLPACAARNENHTVYRSIIGETVAVPLSAPLQLPPLQVTAESVRACVTHMLNMSQPGGYEDVRAEALRTLADMSSEELTRSALMESEENLKTLLRSVADGVAEIHRLATTILANLLEFNPPARAAVRRMNGAELLMARASISTVSQTIRESLRAFLALCSDASAEEKTTIQSSSRFADMFHTLTEHENQRIRDYLHEVETMFSTH
jgi:hypothetical protein